MEGYFNGGSLVEGKVTVSNGSFDGDVMTSGKVTMSDGNRMDGTHYSADGRVIKVYE